MGGCFWIGRVSYNSFSCSSKSPLDARCDQDSHNLLPPLPICIIPICMFGCASDPRGLVGAGSSKIFALLLVVFPQLLSTTKCIIIYLEISNIALFHWRLQLCFEGHSSSFCNNLSRSCANPLLPRLLLVSVVDGHDACRARCFVCRWQERGKGRVGKRGTERWASVVSCCCV